MSLNWGAWSEVGAAVKHNVIERVGSQGLGAIAPEQGLKLLEQLLLGPAPAQVGITPVNWPLFLRHFKGRSPAFLADITPQEQTAATVVDQQVQPQSSILDQLAEAPLNRRRGLLLGYLQEQACKVLGLDSVQAVGERTPLNELGLDSLMAVELRNLLGSSLGLKKALPATLVFDYPTIEAMTDYLGREMSLLEPDGQVEDRQVEVQPELEHAGAGVIDLLAQVEGLSDEEVDRLFAQQLQHKQNWGFDDE